ncbi:MAG: ABC transporter ATP-binding protein [Bacteroidota bacterium]
MSSPETLIQVDHLQVGFGSKALISQAVKGISFTLHKGDILGIVGESGSGKSVTSLSILDLLRSNPNNKTSGQIWFSLDGRRINLFDLKARDIQRIRGRRISMIFQEPLSTFNPVRRCGAQVKEVLDVHDIGERSARRDVVLEAFRDVSLPDVERVYRSYPHELSGGQLQRVSIAMALVSQPELLICDEPTTALDVTTQKEIIGLLQSIVDRRGLSMIFISHDLDVVRQLCSKVLVMYQGEVVEAGELPETFLSPKHPYTQALIACKPTLAPQHKSLPTVNNILAGQTLVKPRPEPVRSSEILISVKNLTVRFPKKKNHLFAKQEYLTAVEDVSFDVNRGDCLGIVGESGSGKSTIANVIAGLIHPSHGRLEYKGQELTQSKLRQDVSLRREIQMVFQDPYSSLNPSMSIGQTIMEPIKYHRLASDPKAQMMKLLEDVGLDKTYRDRYPHQLSGGQRQRVCIARSLALNPHLLICDESVSALDVSVQAQILNLLDELRAQLNLTMIFISHDLAVVNYIADEIIVMQHGQLVESGPCQQIINQPRELYTQNLINSIIT